MPERKDKKEKNHSIAVELEATFHKSGRVTCNFQSPTLAQPSLMTGILVHLVINVFDEIRT